MTKTDIAIDIASTAIVFGAAYFSSAQWWIFPPIAAFGIAQRYVGRQQLKSERNK